MLFAAIADVHMRGKKLSDKVAALKDAVGKIIDRREIKTVYFLGDTFDRRNISDREATTGTIYRAFMGQAQRLIDERIDVVMIKGNGIHEGKLGDQPGPLEALKQKGITIVDEIYLIGNDGNCFVACVPAPDNLDEFQGLQKDFDEIGKIFASQSSRFKVLFHHMAIAGAAFNSGIAMSGSEFEVSPEQLEALGADLILGGHVHKRQKYYVGALCQGDFGEEGNPQGFAVVDTEKRTVEYVDVDAPRYFTLDGGGKFPPVMPKAGDYVKYRFREKPENYDELIADPRNTVEIVPEREVVRREVAGVEAGRSEAELLDAYLAGKGRSEADRGRIAMVARELAGGIR